MKSIYASKLYKSSTRKDKIKAAIENPINAELVAQLAEYLDEDYQQPDANNIKVDYSDSVDNNSSSNDPSISFPSSGGPSGMIDDDIFEDGEGIDSEVDEGLTDDLGDETIDEIDLPSDDDDNLDDEPIEESTKVKATPVNASSCVSLSEITGQIKGTLNLREDTNGVNRVLIKEDELWVHYNDDINLNNVMGDVIELLNSTGYTYLEFNRLARSANAIVFQICLNDTNQSVKPLEVDLDDKEGNN